MFQLKVVEKIKTHISCSVTFFPPGNLAVYESVEKYGGARQAIDDDIMAFMRFACWITKTHTHSRTHNMSYLLLSRDKSI
jgi:hypothetical protein